MIDTDSFLAQIERAARRLSENGEAAIADYLDMRDLDPFDSDWVDALAALEQHKRELPASVAAELATESEQLRKAAFILVLRASNDADLAGYLSDDAGLAFEADRSRHVSPWIDALRDRYQHQQLPSGALCCCAPSPPPHRAPA